MAHTRSAVVLLTLPFNEDERGKLRDLAERTARAQRSDANGRVRVALVRGMAAYRNQDFSAAQRQLMPASQSRDAPQVGVLGRYFLAMSQHQLGLKDRARATLASADEALDRLVKAGNLGVMDYWVLEDLYFDIETRESFAPIAFSLLARDEAETLILGEITSPPMTAAKLKSNREVWKRLHARLLDANLTARRRDYAEAARRFSGVMADPGFSLPAGEQAFYGFPGLGQGMAATFLLADDATHYAEVCRLAYEGVQTNSLDRLTMLVLKPDLLPVELAELASTLAPDWALDSIDSDMPRHRLLLDLGMVRYREGRFEEAARALDAAAKSHNRNWSTLAQVFGAMSYHQLGQAKTAAEHLREAEDGWNTILEYGGGMLFPYWLDQVAIDLTLKEAHRVIGESTVASNRN